MSAYSDLAAWKHGHLLVLDIHRLTASFPCDERFRLTEELRSAALAVPLNIACAVRRVRREGTVDAGRALDAAATALTRLEYLLLACGDLGHAPAEECARIRNEVQILGCMVVALRRKLESAGRQGLRVSS